MRKYGKYFVLLIFNFILSGCAGGLWTTADLIYDRHHLYKKLDDLQLTANANRALFTDHTFKCHACVLDLAVLNGDILLAGHVPDREYRLMAQKRIERIPGYRRFFNQLYLSTAPGNLFLDTWITTKIRSQIVADASINPKEFKVITSDQIVYLMGDVLPEQAETVIIIARQTKDVRRVVTLFKYYHLSESKKKA